MLVVATIAAVVLSLTGSPADHSDLRRIMHRLTTSDGAPGALLEAHGRHGGVVITSGVADVRTGRPVTPGSRFRIGSLTKPFVATVVLQLAGEHRVELDAPVGRYLPGLPQITVRQLLQQTSGLPDYLTYLTPQGVIANRFRHWEPRELLAMALAHPPSFPPGTRWEYSNTNYLVAGMLIERITGRPYGAEIQRRIVRPLGLRDTSVPGDLTFIPGPHPHGYVRSGPGELLDVTRLNPSVAAASGDMISSASDLGRFFAGLLHGRLLGAGELRAMLSTVPTGRTSGSEYGLGIQRVPLRCGGHYWGHDGDILGYATKFGITPRGTRATVMATLKPGGSPAQTADLNEALTTALCDQALAA